MRTKNKPAWIVVVALCAPSAIALGADKGSWWPSGGGDSAAEAAAEKGDKKEGDGWLFRSPFADVKMPEWNLKGPFAGDSNAPSDGQNFLTRPFHKVSEATQGAFKKTQSAWNKTLDRFRITDDKNVAASSDDKPGFFQRMFGAEEEKGAETMQEFVAQERPGLVK